ncbi:MAG: caspase family protein [Blastocatellia bacterium]
MRKEALLKALLLSLIVWAAFGAHQHVSAQQSKPEMTKAGAAPQPELIVSLGHSGTVTSVAFSPNGQYALTGGGDKTACLWEVKTGREIRRFEGHTMTINSVAFTPEGKYILTGGDGSVRMWDIETGREVRRFNGHAGFVFSIKLSRDGKRLLTASGDGSARLWEVETGDEIRSFGRHLGFVSSAVFSPDEKNILTVSLGTTLRLLQIETGKEIGRFESQSGQIYLAAFSLDGRSILTAGESSVVQLRDIGTLRERRQFIGHTGPIRSLTFSRDGKQLLTGSSDGTVRLWDFAIGKEIGRFETGSEGATAAAFSPDERLLLIGTKNIGAQLRDVATGNEVARLTGYASNISAVTFSPDGRYILSAGIEGNSSSLRLWDVETGKEARLLEGFAGLISTISFSRDGKYGLATGSEVRLWETETGKEVNRFLVTGDWVALAEISPDGKYILAVTANGKEILWETSTGKEVKRFGDIGIFAFSPDGKYVLTRSGYGGKALLRNSETGEAIRQFDQDALYVASAAFSSDGKYILTGNIEGVAQLWEVETGKRIRNFTGTPQMVSSVAFSKDGKYAFTSGDATAGRLWDVETGKELRWFEGIASEFWSVEFSPNGKYLITFGRDSITRIWNVETGQPDERFVSPQTSRWGLALSHDTRYMLTGGTDSTTRLWNTSEGNELCRFISFRDNNWAVVTPEGRFDASNLDDIKGLQWIMPDDRMKLLPIEIFMRDYYEPRLLPRILSGESFKPIQSIATLNRVQPKITITAISPQKDDPDLVSVDVRVSKASSEFKKGDKTITRETSVYDLRLFRDSQLVAELPEVNASASTVVKSIDVTPEEIRKAWREQSRVRLEANGEQVITFANIRLPRRADVKQVEFSAYAFNEDRVKSQTDKKTFALPKDRAPLKGRVYLLTVGVNAYENRAWNLQFAANDALLAHKVLSEGLKQSGEFADVVNIALISDSQPAEGGKPATKANVKAALEQIASRARPEDVVMIYYSSHGYADYRGNYYFFPADTGPGEGKEITPELLSHCISSDELSAWLQDIDAGEIALIVDACQSAGTVKGEAGEEFKPGPMGSRGLGQLAYDKRMRILAASQADDFAFEIAALQHGLLTYALMKDGIEGRKADFNRDGQVTLSEALTYSLARVPKLYEAMRSGKLAAMFKSEGGRGPQVVGSAASLRKKNAFQQPVLFDFAKQRREVVLAR